MSSNTSGVNGAGLCCNLYRCWSRLVEFFIGPAAGRADKLSARGALCCLLLLCDVRTPDKLHQMLSREAIPPINILGDTYLYFPGLMAPNTWELF